MGYKIIIGRYLPYGLDTIGQLGTVGLEPTKSYDR